MVGLPVSRVIAVTGGLGFVGKNLVQKLAAAGHQVRVLDIESEDLVGDLPARVSYRKADLRDGSQTREALADADLVFHLAGNSSGTVSVENPRLDFETNALGTFNVCDALRHKEGARLVYLSSAMTYGQPRHFPVAEDHPVAPYYPYGASKLSGEFTVKAFVETYGLSAAIGRAFVIYGPGEDPRRAGAEVGQYLRWHLNGLPIEVTGDPDRKTRDFIHVSDIVAGLTLIAAAGEAGEVYNLGTGEETSLRELVAAIGRVSGSVPETVVNDVVTDDTYRLVADVTKLRALGYAPSVQLDKGLTDLIQHLGDHPAPPMLDTIFRPSQRGAAGSL
ncbi:NAD-dependent epimerase/dehydratase family protein [Streptomyces violaceus]|uniref:NAD-dependent epimerase/dehydratase family protein n=1 Tax=Streptomyces violaceus TaxID=1936 RepID=UPI002E2D2833|nr:NAD-dependent epimerase/dehydratase family protein [Streptomyces violaceus]